MMTDSGRFRVGLVGAGNISALHMRAWQEYGADVTVFSLQGAEELARRFGASTAPDLESLLDAVDLVDIVTPSGTHEEIALAAIAAGRHVICEKPLASTPEGAERIVLAARAAGVRVFPAHVCRYFPEYVEMKRQLDAGRIGRPAVVRLSRVAAAPPPGSWFFDEDAGGGVIRDLLIHDLDLARWLAGEVTSVYAVQSPASRGAAMHSCVVAQVVLTHEDGAICVVHGSWGPAGMPFRTTVDVAGSAGTLHYSSRGEDAVVFEGSSRADGDSYLPAIVGASPYSQEIREFAEAIREGGDARVSDADGIAAVRIADAAYLSIRSGEPVRITAEEDPTR